MQGELLQPPKNAEECHNSVHAIIILQNSAKSSVRILLCIKSCFEVEEKPTFFALAFRKAVVYRLNDPLLKKFFMVESFQGPSFLPCLISSMFGMTSCREHLGSPPTSASQWNYGLNMPYQISYALYNGCDSPTQHEIMQRGDKENHSI